jgi:hypothetical protein
MMHVERIRALLNLFLTAALPIRSYPSALARASVV